ncbi:MAG: Co2+/Mg2+ efflux protein ApaG [SAR324 cluster bacterium]|nr:Co2+/Mg2+ efflux protein ApaG [SAR324 cluster bacterium]
MVEATTRGVTVFVESFYIEEHSEPDEEHYVFAYRIRLHNRSEQTVQLISRHWIISDSNGETSEVKGEGVVGEQPILVPGGEHEYMSGSHLKSPMGTMHGTYQMQIKEGEMFDAEIPCFTLAVPGVIN